MSAELHCWLGSIGRYPRNSLSFCFEFTCCSFNLRWVVADTIWTTAWIINLRIILISAFVKLSWLSLMFNTTIHRLVCLAKNSAKGWVSISHRRDWLMLWELHTLRVSLTSLLSCWQALSSNPIASQAPITDLWSQIGVLFFSPIELELWVWTNINLTIADSF